MSSPPSGMWLRSFFSLRCTKHSSFLLKMSGSKLGTSKQKGKNFEVQHLKPCALQIALKKRPKADARLDVPGQRIVGPLCADSVPWSRWSGVIAGCESEEGVQKLASPPMNLGNKDFQTFR